MLSGFDIEGPIKYRRAPGTAPGILVGITTTDSLAIVDDWRKRHDLNEATLEETASRIRGGKDIYCNKVDVQ